MVFFLEIWLWASLGLLPPPLACLWQTHYNVFSLCVCFCGWMRRKKVSLFLSFFSFLSGKKVWCQDVTQQDTLNDIAGCRFVPLVRVQSQPTRVGCERKAQCKYAPCICLCARLASNRILSRRHLLTKFCLNCAPRSWGQTFRSLVGILLMGALLVGTIYFILYSRWSVQTVLTSLSVYLFCLCAVQEKKKRAKTSCTGHVMRTRHSRQKFNL